MSDEQVINLLQEIRDLQKQQIENSKLALSNQQQVIATQQGAVRRARTLLLIVGAILLALYFLPVFWWGLGWGLRCALRR
jgi:CHASE3 domain sensor protein